VTKIYVFEGLKKVEIPEAGPGEIISLAGLEEISIGDTIADPEHPIPLERIHVDERHVDGLQGQRRAVRRARRASTSRPGISESGCSAKPTGTSPSALTPSRPTPQGVGPRRAPLA